MRVIAGSLGVGCGFCHVQDRSKDDMDTKKTARLMMAMMMEINKNKFDGRQQVTCFTCHNGSSTPASTLQFPEMAPAAPQGGGEGRAQGPSADQILASYVQALGGEQAIRKIANFSITATRDAPAGFGGGAPAGGAAPAGGPPQAQVEEYLKAPNLMVTIVHAPNGMTTANGFDGTVGWTLNARGVVADLTGTDEARAARAADFYEALDLSKEYGQLTAGGTAKVGDHNAYVLVGTPQGDLPERLYFDTTTGLLLRKITITPTPMGNSPTQIDYDDYRDTGSGIKFPYLIRVTETPNARVATHVQKVDSAPIDNSFKLMKPASKAAQAQ